MAKRAYIGVGNTETFESRELPTGYQQLAYIESTGTQYIDTGINGYSGLSKHIELDHEYNDMSSTQIIIGSWKNSSTRFYPISTDGYFGYGSKVSVSSVITYAANVRYKISSHLSKSKQNLIINGETIYETPISTTTVDTGLTMYLFAVNYAGSADYYAKAKVRSCKITSNGSLARDFVPCRNASGEAGMYDLVGGKFYGNAGTGEFIGSDESFARKIKNMYIGVDVEVPVYGLQIADNNVTATNISEFFTVTNDTYYFKGVGSTFTTTNGGVNSSTATTTLTALKDMNCSFSYSYSSEANYDKFTLTIAGTTIENGVSGSTTNKTWSGSLKQGQTLVFTYAKDVSSNSNSDACTFSNMVVTCESNVQVGIEYKGVARRVKKAYIGIGGVARPFFSCGILEKWGTATPLSSARRQLAATTVGNYALFGGGIPSDANNSKIVDAYNSSLVHSVPTAFTNVRYSLAATRIGNYALFGGGSGSTGTAVTKTVEAYDASLTHSSTHELSIARQGLAATRVGSYALFGGGKDYSDSYSNVVDAYNLSLTSSTPSTLSTARTLLAATTVGDYALFGGGYTGSSSKIVNAYNTSLTRTTPTALNTSRRELAATMVGDYALFAGGYNGTYLDVVDAYDTSLTRSTPAVLTSVRARLAATTIGTYALFGGGCISSSSYSSTVDVYDVSLTHTTSTGLSNTRKSLSATTVGDYALFGGGDSYSSPYERDTVDVYAI